VRKYLKTQNNQTWHNCKEFEDHEFLMALGDEKAGLRAFIAVHNTNRGTALGGTRIAIYHNESEAIKDVLNLSRAMSYKCALANLPFGGGKGVIIFNNHAERGELLVAYAKLVEKLGGLLKTGTDVGTTDKDVALMSKHTSYMLGVKSASLSSLTTSKAAALGVFNAMKATLSKLNGSNSFVGKSVAIKGVGKLGGELARLVSEAGGTVFISDINDKKCKRLQKSVGNINVTTVEDIHKQTVDIYSPCAMGGDLTKKVIRQLNCKAIVGGANNQLASAECGYTLHEQGILYIPDYLANAGGLIYVADELESEGFKESRVINRIKGIEQTTLEILSKAEEQNSPPYRVADLIARSRMASA
jgi:glutamate dehydrogenase/leucine dehydrogenase